MKVLMVEPGAAPYEKELNGLHEMQAAVGGLIQATSIPLRTRWPLSVTMRGC